MNTFLLKTEQRKKQKNKQKDNKKINSNWKCIVGIDYYKITEKQFNNKLSGMYALIYLGCLKVQLFIFVYCHWSF